LKKEEILKEIKLTAKANGGVPLGQSRFSQATGIKTSDWLGKLWARWGDAVREAGFEPNELQSAYDEDLLIDKFIGLMRELGRFPVSNEIKMKARNDYNFPWHNTFARLGGKQQLAKKILGYCLGRSGYDDVVAWCQPIVSLQKNSPENIKTPEISFGYVYLMKSGKAGNVYKIGWSKDPMIRQYQLQTGSPEPLNTVHEIKTDDPSGIESYWHKRFSEKRIDPNKEWFKLSTDDVKAFKKMRCV
jgi:hypothetical protein